MNLQLQYEPNRIYANDEEGKMIAEITYPAVGNNTVVINHTFVDTSLRGQGVADLLMRSAVSDIQNKGFKLRATCSYAQKWFEKHSQLSHLLDQ